MQPSDASGTDVAPVLFRKLPRAFFDRNTAVVARELLGHWIVRRIDGTCRVGRIVETEAYLGPHDLASHSSKGCTPRNRSMFGPPGHAYVYLIYGLHHCLNVVTEPAGHGAAVLLRALEPVLDLPGNTRGPGLLCRALSVDRSLDGMDLLGDTLFLAEPEMVHPEVLSEGSSACPRTLNLSSTCRGGALGDRALPTNSGSTEPGAQTAFRIVKTPRVGVDYAGPWARRLLRFHIRDNAWVSRR